MLKMQENNLNKIELQIAIIGSLNVLISDIDLITIQYAAVSTIECDKVRLKVLEIKRQAQSLVNDIKGC